MGYPSKLLNMTHKILRFKKKCHSEYIFAVPPDLNLQLGHLPLTGKGRVGCSALSSLRSLGFFEFSILAFSIFDFGISIFGRTNDHLGYVSILFLCAWHI